MANAAPAASAGDLHEATEAAVRGVCASVEAARASLAELQKALRAEPDSASVICALLHAASSKAKAAGASIEVLAPLELSWEREAVLEANALQGSLESRLTGLGWSFEGAWPSFMVQRAVPIEFSKDRGSVLVGGQRIAPVSSARVQAALERIVPDLLPRTFDPRVFLEQLHSAAARARVGNSAPLMAVYKECVVQQQPATFWRDVRRERFAPLSIHQFRARLTASLSALTQRKDLGVTVRLSPPLKPDDGLFLFVPADNRYSIVGSIEFLRKGEA